MSAGLAAGDVIVEGATHRPTGAARAAAFAYQGYRERNVAPAVHLGLPSPFLTLIFTLDEPLTIKQHVDPRRTPGTYETLVGGLHTSPALITHDGAQSGIQLLVNPLASRALLGVPASDLAGYDGDARELLGPLATEIHDRLGDATTWTDRFGVLDEVLGRRMRRADEVPVAATVAEAWQLLTSSGGRLRVGELAANVGYSERHLTNLFRAELGVAPKAAARVIRFDRARRTLQRDRAQRRGRAISDVAATCGYADQSHLVRDFVSFTGRSPSRWLAEEFGNVQARAVPDFAYFEP